MNLVLEWFKEITSSAQAWTVSLKDLCSPKISHHQLFRSRKAKTKTPIQP